MDTDATADRYRDATEVIREVVSSEDFPEGDVERIEISLLASGEATYRVWPARAEDPVGGYLPPPSQPA